MRGLVICGLAGAAILLIDARSEAEAGAWCAQLNIGATNCGFDTFEQCMANVRGIGGSCYRNPQEPERPAPVRRKKQ